MPAFLMVLQAAFLLFFPAAVLALCRKVAFLRILGPVFLCYAGGFLVSLLPVPGLDKGFPMSLAEIMIPLAIPMILFSADLKSLSRLGGRALLSFGLGSLAVVLAATLGFFLSRDRLDGSAEIAGMLTGLYTGGTPNLMAIGVALGVSGDRLVLANTADMVAGALYFLLLLTVADRLVRKVLKSPVPAEGAPAAGAVPQLGTAAEYLDVEVHGSLRNRARLLLPFLASVLGLGLSAGLALLLTGTLDVAIVMVGVTTAGILGSLVRPLRTVPGTYAAGQYLIYIFSAAIGMSMDLHALGQGALPLLVLLLSVQFGAVLLHLLFCLLFRIDAHTMLITSTAGIFGPAFIPPVANALSNRAILLPGLLCGILGYAIGNYLGIGLALLLRLAAGG